MVTCGVVDVPNRPYLSVIQHNCHDAIDRDFPQRSKLDRVLSK